jgi:hypothetical protein
MPDEALSSSQADLFLAAAAVAEDFSEERLDSI